MNPSLRLALAVAFATATAAHAQLTFIGSPSFSIVPPYSAPGNTITQINPWVFSPLPMGFSITGRVMVTVPPGTSSGVLLAWDAAYQIDNFPSNPGTYPTTTAYTGFITAPAGGAADGGVMTTQFTDKTLGLPNPASVATISFSYAPGAGTTNFPPPGPASSAPFTYTPAPPDLEYIEQFYSVSYSYSGAVPGIYILDFPATSTASVTPEPTAAALLGFGAPLLLGLRRRRQSQG